ncbi:unnamed protein product [Thelazia callipaeda]|uniref:Uncharacterized protein n=1 Tax=Thelazia callipaeda TaxID=103827 RepID=A0A3P7KHJ3_THECL|nr:unnamed protein product [Thelazia callipaeda]
MQLNVIVSIESFSTFRWIFIAVSFLFILSAIAFLIVGIAATCASSAHSNLKSNIVNERSLLFRIITSPCLLGSLSLVLSALIIFWSMIVSVVAVFTSFYMTFISAVYSFCNMIDDKCLDFRVLLPVIVNRIKNKKVDLIICKDKKEALCAAENNQIWSFIGALFFSFLALTGLIYFLMCLSANYTRIRMEKRARKRENYAMNQGTVDSNSFILTNMSK